MEVSRSIASDAESQVSPSVEVSRSIASDAESVSPVSLIQLLATLLRV